MQRDRCQPPLKPSAVKIDRTGRDVPVWGLWSRGTECILDFRVTDPSAKSYRKKDPIKVLETQEKEKKDKYLRKCLDRRKHFTPMVFSVDGMAGKEAKKTMKHLASLLAEKWEPPHGQMVHFVQTNMSISLCRSVTLMLQGGRICFAGLIELPSPLETTQCSVSRLATTSSSKLLIVPATSQPGGLVGGYCMTKKREPR